MEKICAEKKTRRESSRIEAAVAAASVAANQEDKIINQIGKVRTTTTTKSSSSELEKFHKITRSSSRENVNVAVSAASICCGSGGGGGDGDIPVSVVVATIAATITDVMGGGFTTPPAAKGFFDWQNQSGGGSSSVGCKGDGSSSSCPKKIEAINVKRKTTKTTTTAEQIFPTPQSPSESTTITFSESPSVFNSALPGLGRGGGGGVSGSGGSSGHHKSFAQSFFLDSPDEPPDFEYQHFSATDSSNSLEGNCDFVVSDFVSSETSVGGGGGGGGEEAAGERESGGGVGCGFGVEAAVSSTLSYSGLLSMQSSMGSEVSTNSSSYSGGGGGGGGGDGGVVGCDGVSQQQSQKKPQQQLHTQSSTKSDGSLSSGQTFAGGASTTGNRSCSLTNETINNSSTKFRRLQNFLFKSTSESSKSFQGYSNDGYAASSHGSSSGEWESVLTAEAGGAATTSADTTTNYYQYSLTSPNNPFLPEIIARSYHNDDDDNDNDEENKRQQQHEQHHLAAYDNIVGSGGITLVTSVNQVAGMMYNSKLSPSSRSSTFSRGGSGEEIQQHHSCSSTSSLEQQSRSADNATANTKISSPGGRHKRKLFLLNSPIRSGNANEQQQKRMHPQQRLTLTRSKDKLITSPQSATTPSPSPSPTSTVKNPKNPFISTSANQTKDLNIKREEFLRSTMKICLVISPPTNKLQLKSKSLTHLDGLNSIVTCDHETEKTHHVGGFDDALGKNETSLLAKPVAHSPSHPFTSSVNQEQCGNCYHPSRVTTCASNDTLSPNRIPPPTVAAICSSSFNTTMATAKSIKCLTQRPLNLQCEAAATAAAAAVSATQQAILSPVCVTTVTGRYFPFDSGGRSSVGVSNATATLTTTAPHDPSSSSSVPHAFHPSISGPTTTMSATHKKKSSFLQRKKPILTRSEVSSSEYFSVSFCTENGCQDEEFFPTTKGVTLFDALSNALRRRNMSFSQIVITSSNNLPNFPELGSFDENTEVENLVGRHLVISERGDGGSKKTLQKAASFGSRQRPPRLLSSASTEETSESVEQRIPGKQLKQRWSGLFGIKNPQQSQLCELLNSYAKNGVPQRSTTSVNYGLDEALEYLDKMHNSWKDFVHYDQMSENEVKIQTAIWELVTTEVYYIHALQTVTDLFLACLEAIQNEKLLSDVDQHKLFSNIRKICEANLNFWTLYLYPSVAHSIATHEPLRIDIFRPGFESFGQTFAPYKKYCAEQSTCQFYCKELNRTNALFTSYLTWCESQKMCNRLRLADILVRPMQRLTKYSLLLAAIRKHVTDPEDAESIDTMIHTVENFVCSVNNHLTTRQESERLKGVMARIESYDVVDTNNEQLDKLIKQHSQMFDLCAPMKGVGPVAAANQVRHLFMEGDHKYKDNLGKADVHCFLLTDMLLVCKSMAKKGLGALKVIRQPYLTDRLIAQHNNNNSNVLNCVYLNEFQVAVTAFTLQCSEAKNWYDSLKRAKLIYTRLKQGSGSGGSGGSNNWEGLRFGGGSASSTSANVDTLGVRKSPMNSSICSHVSSTNNSHSGSVEWNESRNISVEFEKTNSLSSDEGSTNIILDPPGQGYLMKLRPHCGAASPHKHKIIATSANTLSVEPLNLLGQSLPNLNFHHNQSHNTLLVPGTTTSSHSGNLLLSPSHRGKSYPPPSPPRATLRRGMAFSASIKNPPLVKTRNITSQNSINWHQIPATPTPTSPQSQDQLSKTSQQQQQQQPPPTMQKSSAVMATTNSQKSTSSDTAANSTNSLHISSETDV